MMGQQAGAQDQLLFAHLKRILKLDRLRLRGLTGATDEFTLVAAVQNLRRLARLIPQRPAALSLKAKSYFNIQALDLIGCFSLPRHLGQIQNHAT